MTVLSEIYLELDIVASEEDVHELEQYFLLLVQQYASLLLRQSVKVGIEHWQGSLKAVIVVTGFMYAAICGYGSFRSGVDSLIKDAKSIKQYVRESLIKDGLPEDRIIELKRRQCTPDRIRRIFLRIDGHAKHLLESDDISALDRESQLISNMVSRVVLEDLDCEQDAKALLDSLAAEYKKSPNELYITYQVLNQSEQESSTLELAPGAEGSISLSASPGSALLEPQGDFRAAPVPKVLRKYTTVLGKSP